MQRGRRLMDGRQKSYVIPPSALMALAKYIPAPDADLLLRMTQRFYALTFGSICSPRSLSFSHSQWGQLDLYHILAGFVFCWTKHSAAGRPIVQRSAAAADEAQTAHWGVGGLIGRLKCCIHIQRWGSSCWWECHIYTSIWDVSSLWGLLWDQHRFVQRGNLKSFLLWYDSCYDKNYQGRMLKCQKKKGKKNSKLED